MAQLEFLRDVDYPSRLETYKRRIALLLNFGNEAEENARIAKEELFSYQNSFKAITGYLEPLKNHEVMAAKQADEAKQDAAFKANPKNRGAANPWTEIADSISEAKEVLSSAELHREEPRVQYRAGLLCSLDCPS